MAQPRKSASKLPALTSYLANEQLEIEFVSETSRKSGKLGKIGKSVKESQDWVAESFVREPMRLLLVLTDLDVYERRLYWLVLSQIKQFQQRDAAKLIPFQRFSFTFHYSDILNSDSNPSISRMKEVVDSINERSISWETPGSDHYSKITVFPFADYVKGTGNILLTLNPVLIPGFLVLGNSFAEFHLKYAMLLSSEYSQIIYTHFMKQLYCGKWVIPLERFREILGIKSKGYDTFSNLRLRILDPLIQHINEVTQLQVEYKTVIKSRSVVALSFSIINKDKDKVSESVAQERLKGFLEAVRKSSPEENEKLVSEFIDCEYDFFSRSDAAKILNNPLFVHRFVTAQCYISAGLVKPDKVEAYLRKSIFNPAEFMLAKP